MGRSKFRWVAAVIALCATSACGGGGGGGGGGSPTPVVPDVALLFVSGHQGILDGSPSTSYLDEPDDAGPAVVSALQASGYSLSVDYFVDDGYAVGGFGGYVDLVAALDFIRASWAPFGTRVVIVCHSHGGVWTHEAIRSVSALPITCLVDLDCSSYGWGTVGHDLQNDLIGGDPRDAWDIGGTSYDSEDVVSPNVQRELEVRSGAFPPFALERYDETWNVRLDGTTTGLDHLYSGTDHTEVHKAAGTTIPYAIAWIRARLAE